MAARDPAGSADRRIRHQHPEFCTGTTRARFVRVTRLQEYACSRSSTRPRERVSQWRVDLPVGGGFVLPGTGEGLYYERLFASSLCAMYCSHVWSSLK